MKNETNARKPYKKPELKLVELKADEVLSTGCKAVTGMSSGGVPPCWSNSCQNSGS